ncbi:hypothetical protein D3C83_202480 [compost metagenome]
MLRQFAEDADMESVMIDSTIVYAHPCAAGAQKKAAGRRRKPWDVAEAGLVSKCILSSIAWVIRCAFT